MQVASYPGHQDRFQCLFYRGLQRLRKCQPMGAELGAMAEWQCSGCKNARAWE